MNIDWPYLLNIQAEKVHADGMNYWVKSDGLIKVITKAGLTVISNELYSLDVWCACVSEETKDGRTRVNTHFIPWESVEMIQFVSDKKLKLLIREQLGTQHAFGGQERILPKKEDFNKRQEDFCHVDVDPASLVETEVPDDDNFLGL